MSEIRINDDSKDYLDENSLVEDDYYCHIKDMIKCKSCDKIILNVLIRCNESFLTFCKNCSEENLNMFQFSIPQTYLFFYISLYFYNFNYF